MTTAEILAQFPNQRALVAGHVCLDRWRRYDPSLASASSAPVIALRYRRPGGWGASLRRRRANDDG